MSEDKTELNRSTVPRAQRTIRIVTDDVYNVPGAEPFAAALDSFCL